MPYESSSCRRSYSNYNGVKLLRRNLQKHECGLRLSFVLFRAMDEDSLHFSFNDTGSDSDASSYILSSSEGEESDGEEMLNSVINDLDVPSINEKLDQYDDSLRMTSLRVAMLGKGHRKDRIKYGVLINMGLITFLAMLLLVLDSYAWRVVRLPLPPFYFTRPFLISAVLVSFAGYMCVPLLRGLKIRQIVRKEGTFKNFSRKGTPTMGGLFFIPIGVMVAMFIVGFSSVGVSGAAAVTLAFAAIGLIDDIVGLVKLQNYGLSPWIKVLLEVAVSTWFSLWLNKTSIPSPYGM